MASLWADHLEGKEQSHFLSEGYVN